MCRIDLKAMNSTQYPSTIWQGHDKGHERNTSFSTMSSGDLPALLLKWLKKREKYSRQRYLWTICRSVVPWRCTTRFRPAVRLWQLEMVPRCLPIPCPRQDSEGGKSRPLDHMRQIPFVGTSVPPYWLKLRFSDVYIYDNVVILSSMWYVLRFEHAYGLKRYNDRRMTRGQTTCSLGGTASLGLLLPYFILTIFIPSLPTQTKCLARSAWTWSDKGWQKLNTSHRYAKKTLKNCTKVVSFVWMIQKSFKTKYFSKSCCTLVAEEGKISVSSRKLIFHSTQTAPEHATCAKQRMN